MNAENNDKHRDRLLVSYILCAVGFVSGFSGLHRLYNGKIGTGLFWLCTLGVFGVGQVLDLFFISGMVDEHEMKLRLKGGLSPLGVPLNQPVVATEVYHLNEKQLTVKLIEAAENKGGSLTVTQGVKATGASFAEVEAALKELLKSNYVSIGNDPVSGAVTYYFHELN